MGFPADCSFGIPASSFPRSGASGISRAVQDPHRATLVEDICRTADAIDRLQKVVDDADNLRVKGSTNQPVAMPELAELRQYRALKASLLKNLALPDTEELMASKADHLTDVRRAAASARFTKGA
ncbi:ISAfe2, transposase [Mycobacteroides abscessus subsp. abscessus]|nr:ISAfe2, transposase [Mycobacteroides abscessus subsp. abscessus]